MATTTSTPTPADAIGAALSAHPGATAAELAEMAGIGRSTANKALATLEQAGTARRTPGGREGGRRLPDGWQRVDPNAPDTPPADDRAEPIEAAAGRLGKGALRDLVLAYLAAHADSGSDGDGLGPTANAKGLGGKSSGAVGNALQRLEEEGRVRLVQVSPRRYRPTGS